MVDLVFLKVAIDVEDMLNEDKIAALKKINYLISLP